MTMVATTLATNVVLGWMAVVVLCGLAFYVVDLRDQRKYPQARPAKLYVPPEWLPEQEQDDIDLEVWR